MSIGEFKCPHCKKKSNHILYKATIKESGTFFDLLGLSGNTDPVKEIKDCDHDYTPAEREFTNTKLACPECGKIITKSTLTNIVYKYIHKN